MTVLDVSQAREGFADTINRASYGRERTAIRRRGKIVAGIVSAEDLELLEKLTMLQDVEDVKQALAAAAAKKEQPIPWEKAKKRLRL
jgi:PHD/YefM family antitoxin component YafN of YafNO toxin-antitoxin module